MVFKVLNPNGGEDQLTKTSSAFQQRSEVRKTEASTRVHALDIAMKIYTHLHNFPLNLIFACFTNKNKKKESRKCAICIIKIRFT